MNTEHHFRLCGGTFFNLLLQANDNCSASQDLRFRDFLGIIDPQVLTDVSKGEAYDKLHTYASKFRNCKQVPTNGKYIKLGNEKVCMVFQDELKREATAPITRVKEFADSYIPERSRLWLVRCLLELIESDTSIGDNEIFYIKPGFAPSYKIDFLRADVEIDFYDFLLGIWFYVYKNCKDNTVGEKTIQRWYRRNKENVEGVFDATAIGASEKYQNIVLRENKPEEQSAPTSKKEVVYLTEGDIAPDLGMYDPDGNIVLISAEQANRSNMENRMAAYMRAAYKKYSKKRTFIYDTERPFVDFYVCNDVAKRAYGRLYAYSEMLYGKRVPDEVYHNISVSDFKTNKSCLVGQGGLGKSMMVNHLFLDAVDNYPIEEVLPVITALSDYDPEKRDLMYLISRSITRFDRKIELSDIQNQFDAEPSVVLLDGLDEVKKEYVLECKKEIEIFADQFPKCKIIISSRDMSELRSIEGFQPYYLCPLTENQAFEMVNKLDPVYVDEDLKERFIRDVKAGRFRFNDKEKREFFGNPLFLSIMVVTYSQTNNIPTQRYLFYEQAYRAMSTRHDGLKGLTRNFATGLNERNFQKYFGQFCADSYADYNLKFSRDLMERYLEKVIRDNGLKTSVDMFFKDITEKLCLMYLDGNEYRFIHRSFQEYFAAYYFTTLMDDEYKDIYEVLTALDYKIASDETISMLCGLDQKRFERYVVIPLLEELFGYNNDEEDYKSFIRKYYSEIEYVTGTLDDEMANNSIQSALYKFVSSFYYIKEYIYGAEFGDDESLADSREKYYCISDYRNSAYGDMDTVDERGMGQYTDLDGELYEGVEIEAEGYVCTIDLGQVVSNISDNDALWEILFSDSFSLKKEFNAAKELLEKLRKKYAVIQTKKRRFGLGL